MILAYFTNYSSFIILKGEKSTLNNNNLYDKKKVLIVDCFYFVSDFQIFLNFALKLYDSNKILKLENEF